MEVFTLFYFLIWSSFLSLCCLFSCQIVKTSVVVYNSSLHFLHKCVKAQSAIMVGNIVWLFKTTFVPLYHNSDCTTVSLHVSVWLWVDGVHGVSPCYVLLPDCVLQAVQQCSLHTCSHKANGDHSTGL